jgi:hypothetical protein
MVDIWQLLNLEEGPSSPGFERAGQPLVRRLPSATTSFENLLSDPSFQQAMSGVSPQTRDTLLAYQLDRIRQGNNVLPVNDSIKAALAAETGRQATPIEDRSLLDIPGNVVKDITGIVKSLPQIPKVMADEGKDILDGFDDNRRELKQEGITNPVAQFLNMPGVRMLPGTFVAGKAASGDFGDIVRHPLLSTLDVLPYATQAAASTKVAKAAQLERATQIAAGTFAPKARPLKTVLTRKLDAGGLVTPNALGQMLDRAATWRPVAAVTDSMGVFAREAIRDVHLAENFANTRQLVTDPADKVGTLGKVFTDVVNNRENLMSRFGLTPEREVELSRLATLGDEASWKTLPANEQNYLNEARRVTRELGEITVAEMPDLLGKYHDEFYPRAVVNRLEKAEAAIMKANLELFGGIHTTKTGKPRKVKGVYENLVKLAAEDPRWVAVQDLVDGYAGVTGAAGDIAEAAKLTRRMRRFGGYDTVTDAQVAAVRQKIAGLATREAVWRKRMTSSPPARFDELINDIAGRKAISDLAAAGVITDIPAAERWLSEGVLDQIPGLTRDVFRKEVNAVKATWKDLRAAGANPIFMQRVTAERANRIGRTRFDGSIPSLQAAKQRVADMSPSQNSIALAISHQAQDIINRQVGQQVAEQLGAKYGVTESVIREQMLPEAVRLAARDSRYNVDTALNKLMLERYRPYKPELFFPWAGSAGAFPGRTAAGTEQLWVPRQVASVLQQANKEGFTKLRTYSDPVTRTFRVSLLALSPRWHIYNIVGGAMMTMAEAGPGSFRNFKLAYETAKAARDGMPLPVALPDEISRVLGSIGHDEAELAFKKGAAARFLADNRFFKTGKQVIEKSYEFNALWDDMYKTMSFLEGERQALNRFTKAGYKPGIARELARQEGITTARKVLQDTAALTPLERSVFRQVVPFYSWLSHLLRFVYQYPLDHPWRASIVAQLGEQAIADLGEGAPLTELDQIYWGEPDAEGRQRTLRAGSFNPFADVGNMFSLAGWLGQAHPLFKTAAQALGIDTRTGMASLYPATEYDPETGKEMVSTANPVTTLLRNTVPQVGVAADFFGLNSDFNQFAQRDPEAATRLLWGGLGAPTGVIPTNRSPKKALIQAEVNRQKIQNESLSRALKSGDVSRLAEQFPELQQLIPLIEQGQLSGLFDENIQPPRR